MHAYILAGGEGRRFGGDKLAALVEDRPAIAMVAEAAWRAGAEAVYAVTRSGERCRLYTSLAELTGCILDLGALGGGPAEAVYTGLHHAHSTGARLAVFLPGDMPWIGWRSIAGLAAYASKGPAAPLHGGGYLESLMQAHPVEPAPQVLQGMRRLARLRGYGRALDALRVSPLGFTLVGSGLISLSAAEYVHLNTREMLRLRAARNPLGPRLLLSLPGRLRPGEGRGRLCRLLEGEAQLYRGLGLIHLYRQAARDREALCPPGASPGGWGTRDGRAGAPGSG